MKIGIVGCGMVGSTCAFALVMRGVGREIVLVDLNKKRAEAEANDIHHAVPFASALEVRAGDYKDLSGARAVVIAAGVAQKPGENRLQLLQRNAAVFEKVVPSILEFAPEAVLVVVSNPVDVLTHFAAHFAGKQGVQSSRVIGSGTMLDTARFRALLGRHHQVDPQHVHAYVIGEHGDSEVLTWSQATIAGIPLDKFCGIHGRALSDSERASIDDQVRHAAYKIIEGKGSTYYGIGSAVTRLLEAILQNQRAILTITSRQTSVPGLEGLTISLPHIISGEGVVAAIPLNLSEEERKGLARSANILGETVSSLSLS